MPLSNMEIEKNGSSIRLRKQNADSSWTPWTSHNIASIRSVVPNYEEDFSELDSTNRPKNQYPYTDKMEICLLFTSDNGTKEVFDIQQVTNQPTWTADSIGFEQALSDIDSWLVDGSSNALSGTFTPDVIDLGAVVFPYSLPPDTYKSVAIVIGSGESVDFNGVTLTEGSYSFQGQGNQTCEAFTLSNPTVTSASFILVTT